MNNTVNNGDMPLIHLYASGGDIENVKLLLRGQNENKIKEIVNYKDSKGRTPIFYAAGTGKVEMMRYLKEKGADIFLIDNDCYSPMESAIASDQTESIKCLNSFLTESGKKIDDYRNSEGKTPMFGAAALGRTKCIECLVELGAKVNAVDNAGLTPIFVAAMAGQVESIKCLHKLDNKLINATERNGCTPIFLATFVGQTESMKCLKELGADLKAIAGNGMNLMEAAEAAGHSEDSEVFAVLKSLLGTDLKR